MQNTLDPQLQQSSYNHICHIVGQQKMLTYLLQKPVYKRNRFETRVVITALKQLIIFVLSIDHNKENKCDIEI